MAEKKGDNKMVIPRDGVIERAYRPQGDGAPPQNPPKKGINIVRPSESKTPKK